MDGLIRFEGIERLGSSRDALRLMSFQFSEWCVYGARARTDRTETQSDRIADLGANLRAATRYLVVPP